MRENAEIVITLVGFSGQRKEVEFQIREALSAGNLQKTKSIQFDFFDAPYSRMRIDGFGSARMIQIKAGFEEDSLLSRMMQVVQRVVTLRTNSPCPVFGMTSEDVQGSMCVSM